MPLNRVISIVGLIGAGILTILNGNPTDEVFICWIGVVTLLGM